ncbi:MAG: hypothetical protein HWD59_01850 [Coxiellaceae bacterium]|nr:MAG: hypothetical protein HWD59_01850 [Coxiellaceae bacterium]
MISAARLTVYYRTVWVRRFLFIASILLLIASVYVCFLRPKLVQLARQKQVTAALAVQLSQQQQIVKEYAYYQKQVQEKFKEVKLTQYRAYQNTDLLMPQLATLAQSNQLELVSSEESSVPAKRGTAIQFISLILLGNYQHALDFYNNYSRHWGGWKLKNCI